MRADARKLISKARLEGSEEIWTIQCDISEPPDNQWREVAAVLDWGSQSEPARKRLFRLDQSLLFESHRPHVQFEYVGEIVIPSELEGIPGPLTNAGAERGFFRIA
jgi:hypothetical protein